MFFMCFLLTCSWGYYLVLHRGRVAVRPYIRSNGPPFKRIDRDNEGMFQDSLYNNWDSKTVFSVFSQAPGGFRELREAGRKYCHLS